MKSRNSGATRLGALVASGSALRAWHSRRASATVFSDTGPRETRLTRGQKEAVRAVLLSDDLVIGVQGDAGSGKTTMLHEVSELLGERRIHGLAPSAVAARVLQREAGIPTRTLQYFLTRFGDLSDPEGLARGRAEYGRGVLAVDEAAMIDTVRMEELLRIAARLGVARVALVGDTEQLRPVDAASPSGCCRRRAWRPPPWTRWCASATAICSGRSS